MKLIESFTSVAMVATLTAGAAACSSGKTTGAQKEVSPTTSIAVPGTVDADISGREHLKKQGFEMWNAGIVPIAETFRQTRTINNVMWNACAAWSEADGLITLVVHPAQWETEASDTSIISLVYNPSVPPAGKNPPAPSPYTEAELKNGPFVISRLNIDGTSHLNYRNEKALIFSTHPEKKIELKSVTVRPELGQAQDGSLQLIDEETGEPVMQTRQVTREAFPKVLKDLCGATAHDAFDLKSPAMIS